MAAADVASVRVEVGVGVTWKIVCRDDKLLCKINIRFCVSVRPNDSKGVAWRDTDTRCAALTVERKG